MYIRHFVLFFTFICYPMVSFSQNSVALKAFALENEQIFREYVSSFYPMSHELIHRFENDWDWSMLSKNESLDWFDDLIARYENKWKWDILLSNPKIDWTEARLERFSKRIDWFYLSQNPNLPLSTAFLKKHEHEINWYVLFHNQAFLKNKKLKRAYAHQEPPPVVAIKNQDPSQKYKANQVGYFVRYIIYPDRIEPIPKEVTAILSQPIEQADPELFKKHPGTWDWSKMSVTPLLKWDFEQIKSLKNILRPSYLRGHSEPYTQLFKPWLNDTLLIEIMESLYPLDAIPFYTINGKPDDIGYPGEVAFLNRSYVQNFKFPVALSDTFQMPDMSLHSWDGSPPRFLPILDWETGISKPFHLLIVSGEMKAFLQSFNLPPHRFYPFKLSYSDERYGQNSTTYYLFHAEQCNFNEAGYDYDLIVSQCESIFYYWVSNAVKESFEATGMENVLFEKIRKTKVRIPAIETRERKEKNLKITENIQKRRKDTPVTVEPSVQKYRQYCEWREKVLAQKGNILQYRIKNPPPPDNDFTVMTLRQKELDFDVLLPPDYVAGMRSGRLGLKYAVNGDLFDMMKASDIEQLKGWDEKCPFAVKSVLFAENGLGDYLGFLLKEGSVFELDSTVYEFLHETGAIKARGKLRK